MQQSSSADFAREIANTCVASKVGRLHRVVTRMYEERLREAGLTVPQLEVLASLGSCGGTARPAQLALDLSVDRSTISRNLSLLQRRALVRREQVSATGRTTSVALTPEGEQALADAAGAWTAAQSAIPRSLRLASEQLEAWVQEITDAPPPG